MLILPRRQLQRTVADLLVALHAGRVNDVDKIHVGRPIRTLEVDMGTVAIDAQNGRIARHELQGGLRLIRRAGQPASTNPRLEGVRQLVVEVVVETDLEQRFLVAAGRTPR